MFREMRRKKQVLTAEECRQILQAATSGVLAVDGGDGYPYAVPLSYVLLGDKIYFHCARSGHKLDAIARNEKASFCVIGQDQVAPERFTTDYRSVIVFGKIRILEDDAEKERAIRELCIRYAPDCTAADMQKEIGRYWRSLCMLELSIDHMSGKRSKGAS